MSVKDLVVHLDGAERAAERLGLAIALAQRYEARLTALFVESAALGSSMLGGRSREAVFEAMRATRGAFQARTSAADIDARWWELEAEDDHGRLIGSVTVCCRHADLVILGQHEGAQSRAPEHLVRAVVLESGRPVLVVPSAGHYPEIGKRAVIAWTGSRESARAPGRGAASRPSASAPTRRRCSAR